MYPCNFTSKNTNQGVSFFHIVCFCFSLFAFYLLFCLFFFRRCFHRNELKITLVPHLKYASDEDLKQVGLSKPEIRRLRKFYEKYYPHGYLSKIKRLLQNPAGKREEVGVSHFHNVHCVFFFPVDYRLFSRKRMVTASIAITNIQKWIKKKLFISF